MGINLIQWEGSTVTPKLDAIMYDDASYGIIKGCAITHMGTNLLKIAAGYIKIAGRLIEVTEETITCQVSSSGTVSGQLWIRLDLGSVTPVQFMSEAAAVLTPLTQENDCNFTNGVYELQLATYNVDETVITDLDETAPVLEPLRTGLTASGINYDNTHSGLTATKVQGAIDEINDNLGGLLTHYDKIGEVSGQTTNPPPVTSFSIDYSKYKELVLIFGDIGNGQIYVIAQIPTSIFVTFTDFYAIFMANSHMARASYIDSTHIGIGSLSSNSSYKGVVYGIY